MPRLAGIHVCELDLPFRHPFRHAAAARAQSSSLFVRFVTDDGHCGAGEALPRAYVTGEDRAAAFAILADVILPRLLGMSFASFDEVLTFLGQCDGRAPAGWVENGAPHTAAWSAVDLALLDTFARAFKTPLGDGLPAVPGGVPPARAWPEALRFSLVLSGDGGARALTTLLKARLYGMRDIKVKVDRRSCAGVTLARRVFGRRARIRVDTNMDWSYAQAREAMPILAAAGVESFEQPLAADDLDGMARLCAETGLAIVADESIHDAVTLERVIAARACTGISVRIAKCGGLVAALARCRRALEAGLALQLGCLVGETSQLSAAQLVLVRTLGQGVRYLEGCFGERLLRFDPVRPHLQFGRGGRPPAAPRGAGFGTWVDPKILTRFSGRDVSLGVPIPPTDGPEVRT